jgi:DNA-binding CsgD family transcriptional regulator
MRATVALKRSAVKPRAGKRPVHGTGREGASSLSPNRGRVATVLIQDRVRLFRESLRLLLDAAPALVVADAVASSDDLEFAHRSRPVDAVVLEAVGVEWDVPALIGRLESSRSGIQVIGTAPTGARHALVDGATVIPRTSPARAFLGLLAGTEVIEGDDSGAPGARTTTGSDPTQSDLTQREVQVLALIGGGLTTRQIADRLGISVKTVESRRQSLFAKLGVQSQAHAVSVGMRSGIIGSGARS